jgi:hypothetical protein
LIFLLVVEILSRALDHATISGDFQGIKITLDLQITHLLFVDDVLIFCSGAPRDAGKLSEILNLWNTTNIQINQGKSTLSTTSTENVDLAIYKSYFPFSILPLDVGIKYLGFFLKPNC